MSDLEQLLAVEAGFWGAAGDAHAYAEALADDAIHVLPGLGVAGRATVLQGVAGSDEWDACAIEAPQLLPLGEDAAALVYTANAHRGGEPYRAAITSVYRRDRGGWRLALHQQTPL